MDSPAQFTAFNTLVDLSFWSRLMDQKLNVYKLDESPIPIKAFYTNSNLPAALCRISVDFNSLDSDYVLPPNTFAYNGELLLKNTVGSFKNEMKGHLLNDYGFKIWDLIKSGRIFNNVSDLSTFILLCYIDMKNYQYYYWFGYPALGYPSNIRLTRKPQTLPDVYTKAQINALRDLFMENYPILNIGYFLIWEEPKASTEYRFCLGSLSELMNQDFDPSKLIIGFFDPSGDRSRPGWPLRNLLALWAYWCKNASSVKVLCWRYRCSGNRMECEHSLILNIKYTRPKEVENNRLDIYGWEKNDHGLRTFRFLDLRGTMQPEKLANRAVNLNLQLMRWRLVPELKLDEISDAKCILFGAGTLGCNVARCLMGWGVRKITFVDNATVSYSNPVRQSLFTFEDCKAKKPKAEAAAQALKKIFPGVISSGVQLTIPMPGHAVTEEEMAVVMEDVNRMDDLIKDHDVIFLLLDTREGRWLPAILATLWSKLVISVALGFDSYSVIRHGFHMIDPADLPNGVQPVILGNALGCYFCSDVSAPANSLLDRTLDQQCTVTRPGLSMVAAGLAVELMASVLQHPLKTLAPAASFVSGAETPVDPDDVEGSCLGAVPHQIRGYLGRHEQTTPTVQRFSKCVCCSVPVLARVALGGQERRKFLFDVFNDPSTLERVTGLADLLREAENCDILDLSDTESVKSTN